MTCSQNVIGRISMRLAESHYVRVGESHFVQAPLATRGFPHGLIPGVHSSTRFYVEALEQARVDAGRADAPVTEGLFSLPFSAWTQALRPDVEATADSTLRYAFRTPEQMATATGRSYMPDATSEDEALLTEPLFRRPCVASVADNPWASCYDHMEGFFNAANTLSVIARVLSPSDAGGSAQIAVDALWSAIDAFHDHDHDHDHRGVATPTAMGADGRHQWAADACVLLFGALYPATWGINMPMVPKGYAHAAACQARRAAAGERCLPLSELSLQPLDLADCRARWAAFRRGASEGGSGNEERRCAWKDGLAPLLQLLVANCGSHAVDLEMVRRTRVALERAVRGAWLVHSPDGQTPPPQPCPAHRCAAPEKVRRPTLDPVFACSDDLETNPARGALVGIKPHALRQLYALLLGAHLPDVLVQVVRNEGSLSLRVSSAADILEQDGGWRSAKSVSATQTESDSVAFGSREAKLLGCVQQRGAWDANALLLAPIIAPVDAPRPANVRKRGEYGAASYLHRRMRDDINAGAMPEDLAEARTAMRDTALYA
jgi:hypothetical protein